MSDFRFHPTAFESEFADELLVGDWASVLPGMLAPAQIAPWCSYAARTGGRIIGYGGFKGKPDQYGAVEIGYLTFIRDRSQGWAKEICAELIRIAFENNAVTVIAHTQPTSDASTKVLQKQMFVFMGEVDDPDDGQVWRWEKQRAAC